MTELPIEIVPLNKIKIAPSTLNPNVADVGAIIQSIEVNDWYGTIEVNRGGIETNMMIVAGNHRALAAKQLGIKELPVWWVDKTDDEAKAMMLGDNRASAKASTNEPLLAELLQDLAKKNMLAGTLYDGDDLDDLLHDLEMKQTDDTPPSDARPKNPVSKLGDRWEIGGHIVVCGDASEFDKYPPDAVCMITDPPYGVDIGGKNRALNTVGPSDRITEDLSGDQGQEAAVELWRTCFPTMSKALQPGTPFYVFGPQGGDLGFLLFLLLLLRDSGLPPRHILIWVKQNATFSIGRLDYDYQHEPIVYGWIDGGAHKFYGKNETSLFTFDRPRESKLHPTMKPVDLIEKIIGNSSQPDELILDPFGGSGTTLIAAHNKRRKAWLIEIDPGYVDIILARAQEHTGLTPTRNGQAHDFLSVKTDSFPK